MKAFYKVFIVTVFIITAVFAGTNLYLRHTQKEEGRSYRVEIARAAGDISAGGLEEAVLSRYPSIVRIVPLENIPEKQFFEGQEEDYLIREIDGVYYRFDYTSGQEYGGHVAAVNIGMALMAAVVVATLLFVGNRLIKPFHQLEELPLALSKGNLTIPSKMEKSRFFGHFLWGIDLLREHLEQQKQERITLQKEKKTLILSISHDIKTPLSAIKLYAKALSGNLYESPKKQREIAEHINDKADEIEGFVSEIMAASREDFLNLNVKKSEFYLSAVMKTISAYYAEKLELLKIEFHISEYSDCMMTGDADRAVEVLQNIIENAVKYGDGHWIRLEFSDEENCRLITVANSGCTLPDFELPHIFDSFWRGSNTGTSGGSGLGLYICRQLMQKMDGDMFAQCKEEEMRVTAVFQKA